MHAELRDDLVHELWGFPPAEVSWHFVQTPKRPTLAARVPAVPQKGLKFLPSNKVTSDPVVQLVPEHYNIIIVNVSIFVPQMVILSVCVKIYRVL